jgi:ABC-type glutathione transport system ATPase component
MILVSHQLDKIEEVCERCIYLDHGEIRYDGDPIDAIERYRLDVRENRSNSTRTDGPSGAEAQIAGVIFRDRDGHKKHTFKTGDDLIIEIQYDALKQIDQPVFSIGIRHASKIDMVLASFNSRAELMALDHIEGKGSIFCQLSSLPFLEGRYLVSVVLHDHDLTKTYDYHYIRYELEISGKVRKDLGVVQLSHDWSADVSFEASLAPVRKRNAD